MCVLTVDPADVTGSTLIVSPAGPVTIQVASTSGTVLLDQTGTTVTDNATNKQIAGTSFPAADIYSFPVGKGNTYTLKVGYDCVPASSTGTLNEDCTGGIELSQILSNTSAQIFTVKA
jgi:hypothetical protein